MKRYKIEYWNENRSKPGCLIQISKTEKWDGVRISFYNDGEKYWQDNWKNDFMNGINKSWWSDSKKWNFINWKKHKTQGIQIKFK